MVTYHPPDSHFSSETTSPRPRPRQNTNTKTKKWDPVTVLGILNPDPGYNSLTCLGFASTVSRRCRNRINRANRTYILKTMDEISYLDPGSPAVMARLKEIAGTCMCVSWHQNQAGSILSEWRAEISKLVENPPPSTKSEPRDVSPESFVKMEESVEEACSLEDLMRKCREMESRLEKLKREREERTWRQQSPPKPTSKKPIVKQEDEIPSQKWEEIDRFKRRQERLERQRREKERKEQERQEEEERLERERERREKERIRLAKEKQEREEKARRAREEEDTATRNERIRTRAQQKRLEAERLRLEKEESEKREWKTLYSTYQAQWTSFKNAPSPPGGTKHLRDTIPWPVKSGLYRDVQASNVQLFFENTILKRESENESGSVSKDLRKECAKWHPDARKRLPGWTELTDTDHMVMDMICTRLTSLIDRAARKSSECPG